MDGREGTWDHAVAASAKAIANFWDFTIISLAEWRATAAFDTQDDTVRGR
jgi:hypothetical protein